MPAPYLSQQIDQHSQQAMLNMQQSQQAVSNMQQSQQAMSSMQQSQQVPQQQHAMSAHPQHVHAGQTQYMQGTGMWNQYSPSPQREFHFSEPLTQVRCFAAAMQPNGEVVNGDDMQQYQQSVSCFCFNSHLLHCTLQMMGYNQYIGTPYGVMMAPDASGRTVHMVPQMGDSAGYYHGALTSYRCASPQAHAPSAGDFHTEQQTGASGGMMMNVATKQYTNDPMANAYAQMPQARPRSINDANATTMHNDRLPMKDGKRQAQSIYKVRQLFFFAFRC